MARFQWEPFCKAQGIEFVTEGSSWTPGNINIHCPFCGNADPGHHMGLSTSKPYWHCWRNDKHAGRRPHRLIMRLLGCSYGAADTFVGEAEVQMEDFDAAAHAFLTNANAEVLTRRLKMPDTFRVLKKSKGRARMYFNYMVNKRGFDPSEVRHVARRYDLRYCDSGQFRGRIIMPVYRDGELMTWTGRTVYDTEKVRYKALSHKADSVPRGLVSIRELLYNYDHAVAKQWRICAVVEGPMDVHKIDFYGRHHGITAVCPFGTGIGGLQLEDLEDVRDHCKHMVIIGDEGADINVLKLKEATTGLGAFHLDLPRGVEDPGKLGGMQVLELLEGFY